MGASPESGSTCLAQNNETSWIGTPKKALNTYKREMVFVAKVLGLIFDPGGIECE
jgi:hypothetical protein